MKGVAQRPANRAQVALITALCRLDAAAPALVAVLSHLGHGHSGHGI